MEEEGGGVSLALKGVRKRAWLGCRRPESVSSLGALRGMVVGKVVGDFKKAASLGLGDSGGRLRDTSPTRDGCRSLDFGLLKKA